MNRKIKEIDDYQIYLDEKLGNGSFGQVFKGVKKSTNIPVAIKMISKLKWNKSKAQLQSFLKQVQIMDNLNHENIVKYYDGLQSLNNCYIIQQLCDCDLASYLQHQFEIKRRKLSQNEALDILKQICSGCLYLVQKGIVHRDLKPENILLSKGKFKIADFGLSKKNVTKYIVNSTVAGTPCFMAPQVMQNQKYTSKCDIWSIGVIYYLILHGRLPWNGRTLQQIISNTNKQSLIINQNKFSKNSVDFLRKALKLKEVDRFNWKEMLSHPLFDNYFKSYTDQHQKLDYKYQSVVRKLRLKMEDQNKSISQLVYQNGINNKKGLSYEQFAILFNKIDPSLNVQEVNHVFQSFDLDGNGFVSVQQLEDAARKINQKKISPKFIKNNNQFSDLLLENIFRTFLLIKAKCEKQNVNLYDLFIKFGKNKKLRKDQFKLFLISFDPRLKDLQIDEMFLYFDKNKQNAVQLKIFIEIFDRCTENI